MNTCKSNWVRHLRLPYLELYLDIGLLQIQTELMTESYEMLCRNYIALRITLLHKWGWHFRLYSPDIWRATHREY